MAENPATNPEPMIPERADALDDLALELLEPLSVRSESLTLFSRAAPGNHPCHRLGGFESVEEMAVSDQMRPRLKGAVGWLSREEMVRAEVEQARGHGVSGLALLEGIEDIVWELTTKTPAIVATLEGHPLTREVKLTGPAIEGATPRSRQMVVVEALRVYRWGFLDAVELPRNPVGYSLPNGTEVVHSERHIITFGDRVELEAKALGRFSDVIPLRMP